MNNQLNHKNLIILNVFIVVVMVAISAAFIKRIEAAEDNLDKVTQMVASQGSANITWQRGYTDRLVLVEDNTYNVGIFNLSYQSSVPVSTGINGVRELTGSRIRGDSNDVGCLINGSFEFDTLIRGQMVPMTITVLNKGGETLGQKVITPSSGGTWSFEISGKCIDIESVRIRG